MMLSYWAGSEQVSGALAKLYLFHVPRDDKEISLSAAAKNGGRGITLHSNQGPYAASRGHQDAGWWTSYNVEMEDGVMFKVHASRRASWNTLNVVAGVYCRARDTGPLQRIVFGLSEAEGMSFKEHVIEGRFDILTYEEAGLHGAKQQPSFARQFDETMTKRAFKFRVLEPEIAPRVRTRTRVVQDHTGKGVTIVVTQRRRAVSVD